VGLLLVAFSSLFADLPQSALAAIAIAASTSLMTAAPLRRWWRVRPGALAVSLVATAGVVLLGVLEGIGLAVVLSILMFFRRAWWPRGAVLGRVGGDHGASAWLTVDRHPSAAQVQDVVVYRWEAPLFVANAAAFRDNVRRIVAERRPHHVVLQCEAITDIDVTAADMLERLDGELRDLGVHLVFVELRNRLQERLVGYGLADTVARTSFHHSVDLAIEAIRSDGEAGGTGQYPQSPSPS
jgi:MFS superfamily sulfate permease-like transporter